LSFRHRRLSLFRLHLFNQPPSVESRAADLTRLARTAATMKFAIFSLLSIAGFATAQLEDVPECAKPCLEDYTSGNQIADCGQFDIECICSNSDFIDGIACCLDENCDQEGKDSAVKFAQQICGTQGVDVPDQVTCGGDNSPSQSAEAENSEDDDDAATGLKVGIAGAVAAMAFAL